MTATKGLVVGNWTARIQAKALPYNNLQAFSVVITADGFVIPPYKESLPTAAPSIMPTAAPSIMPTAAPSIRQLLH